MGVLELGLLSPSKTGEQTEMAVKIWVVVKPQAKREEVKKVSEREYSASVHAPAREGQANQAVVELLAGHFSVPKSSVRILRGHAGRRKLVEIL